MPELVFEVEVVAASHGLQQLRAHGRFGCKADRTAQDGEGVADPGGGVRLEQRVGVERGGVESLRSRGYLEVEPIHAGQADALW